MAIKIYNISKMLSRFLRHIVKDAVVAIDVLETTAYNVRHQCTDIDWSCHFRPAVVHLTVCRESVSGPVRRYDVRRYISIVGQKADAISGVMVATGEMASLPKKRRRDGGCKSTRYGRPYESLTVSALCI